MDAIVRVAEAAPEGTEGGGADVADGVGGGVGEGIAVDAIVRVAEAAAASVGEGVEDGEGVGSRVAAGAVCAMEVAARVAGSSPQEPSATALSNNQTTVRSSPG